MSLVLTDLPRLLDRAAQEAGGLVTELQAALAPAVRTNGKLDRTLLDAEQHAAHGLAWVSAYAETLRQTAAWADELTEAGGFSEAEALPAQLLAYEYLSQMAGGLPMNQGEIFRPGDLGVSAARLGPVIAQLRAGASQVVKARIVELLDRARGQAALERSGLDETLETVRDQFHAFTTEKITPFAQGWHLRDELIPLELYGELANLGVFGLTAPEAYGGSELGKVAMCVVSEALSRGWIGAGSLGTRSEIAAELILANGTDDQKQRFLPAICSGDIIPTAVFTEPNFGSDLGSLRTRAVREGDVWKIHGAKTWITHGARADVMTLLVRTDPDIGDHRGLSMFLAQKPRGTDAHPFPAPGMSGSEIGVIGYRGMKEYEIGFDGFEVCPQRRWLGGRWLGGCAAPGAGKIFERHEDLHMVGRTAHRALEQMRNLALKNTIGAEPDGIEIALRSSRVFAFLGMIYQKITVYLPVKRAQNPCLLRL